MICIGASRFNSSMALSAFKQFNAEVGSLKSFYADLLAAGMFSGELSEFKRMSVKSKQSVLGAALALFDAGIAPTDDGGNIAVITGNQECCESENSRYFEDYIKYGRVMGRGNLFVNTLPTTPVAEISMAFKLHGPLYFLTAIDDSLAALLQEAELLLETGEADKVMMVIDTPDDIVTLIFELGTSAINYSEWQGNSIELFEAITTRKN
jgi:Beta-ketoacyl synthase, N-terminal domain